VYWLPHEPQVMAPEIIREKGFISISID